MREPLKLLLIILLVGLFSVALAYAIKQDTSVCDEHVILVDGEEHDCINVSSWSNGMSTINVCNGERIDVPTHRIKQITKIKSK
jgi:hypothetical protein